MRHLAPGAFLALLLAVASPGCGGGGGGDDGNEPPPDDTTTVSLPGTKSREGTASQAGALVGNTMNIGDNASNAGIRALMSFSLGTIPAGATILSATLQVEQEDTGFGAPFAGLGTLIVDSVDLGAGVDAADFVGGTLIPGLGAISSSPGNGIRSLDVTTAVVADIAAARTRSEFRLGFALVTDADGAQDTLRILETDNLDGKQDPVLIVEFRP